MKKWWKEKTSIIGIIGASGFIVLLVLLILKIITAVDFAAATGAWATGIATLIAAFAADRSKSEP